MPSRSSRRSLVSFRSHRALIRVEGVESRTLMTSAALPHPLVIATLGDSLTDEYTFYGPPAVGDSSSSSPAPATLPDIGTVGLDSSRNWVSNLAATRSSEVTFGSYSVLSRNTTRNQGFAEDWALIGATASGSPSNNLDDQYQGIASESLPGLLTQTPANSGYQPRDISVVTIEVGINDYLRSFDDAIESGGQVNEFLPASGSRVNPVNAGVEAAIQTAVSKIRKTIPSAKIVVVTPPDITASPLVESDLQSFATLFPKLAGQVSGSVEALNSDLNRSARTQHFGVVDTQALFNQRRNNPTIAGLTLNDQASGQDLTDGFVGDGFHPGTILQGVMAQGIAQQIDAQYGRKVITPLSDADIVAYAIKTQTSVALASQVSATDPTQTTLTAVVASGPGNTSAPTGTVTFESITPASATSPAHFGTILGTVPVGSTGVVSLDVETADLAGGTFYAVYSGDELHTTRISNGLAASSVSGESPIPFQ